VPVAQLESYKGCSLPPLTGGAAACESTGGNDLVPDTFFDRREGGIEVIGDAQG